MYNKYVKKHLQIDVQEAKRDNTMGTINWSIHSVSNIFYDSYICKRLFL